jgi:hypothetical protein
MTDLLTQLHVYGQQIESALGVPADSIVDVSDPVLAPVQPEGTRLWVWMLVGAAVVALLFLPSLANHPSSTVIGGPDSSTASSRVDPTAPDVVAESFMEAWVAGDGEAIAALFSAEGSFNGWNRTNGWNKTEGFPAIHDWYLAVGQEFQSKGCKPQTVGTVACTYTVQNELSRILGREPATSRVVLVVADGKIESVSGFPIEYVDGSGIHGGDWPDELWGMFREWILINHPDDYRFMYVSGSRFGSTSIALWERYTDELTESPGAVSQLLAEWEAGAEARAAYFADAQKICRAASGRYREVEIELDMLYFPSEEDLPSREEPLPISKEILPQITASNEAAARISEEALAELRALPSPPETARGLFSMFYSLAAEQIDLHRQIAAAASAGDIALVETLLNERVDRTHHLDGLLGSCPVGLSA